MRGFVFIIIIISYLYVKLFEWVKLLLIVCRQVLLLGFNWHSWEIYVYSLVALLKLGYFWLSVQLNTSKQFRQKLPVSGFCVFVSLLVNLGQLVVDSNTCAQGAVSFKTTCFRFLCLRFVFLIWVSCRFWFKTCARGAASSETNDQLQAAKLANSTNSAATFPSYWPITFTCQMNNPTWKGRIQR